MNTEDRRSINNVGFVHLENARHWSTFRNFAKENGLEITIYRSPQRYKYVLYDKGVYRPTSSRSPHVVHCSSIPRQDLTLDRERRLFVHELSDEVVVYMNNQPPEYVEEDEVYENEEDEYQGVAIRDEARGIQINIPPLAPELENMTDEELDEVDNSTTVTGYGYIGRDDFVDPTTCIEPKRKKPKKKAKKTEKKSPPKIVIENNMDGMEI